MRETDFLHCLNSVIMNVNYYHMNRISKFFVAACQPTSTLGLYLKQYFKDSTEN